MRRSKQKKTLIKQFLFPILAIILVVVGFQINKSFDILSRAGLTNNYDVVVVGGGSSGVMAAIEAARLGSKVVLIEETDMIGGQLMTVPTVDIYSPKNFGGLYDEFISKLQKYYSSVGLSMSTCYFSPHSICYEPSKARTVLKSMIDAESNITLVTQQKLKSIVKSNNKISGVILNNNKVYNGKYFIDATEYGDVILMSGDNYRVGNKTNTNKSDSSCIQDITYPAVVKKYSTLPGSLKIKSAPPGYTSAVKKVFSNIVVKNGGTFKSNGSISYPVSPAFHNSYRGLPDSPSGKSYKGNEYDKITRTTLNWANDYPAASESNNLLSSKYLYDKTYRNEVNCEAKLRTIQFIYYMQTELGMSSWSIANDEGFNTSYNRNNTCSNIPSELKEIEYNIPPLPYVRESIRGIGPSTLTAKQIDRSDGGLKANKINAKSISLGDYGVDLHECTGNSNLELSLESEEYKKGSYLLPFQIPADILYSSKIGNLIYSEKNISQSRLANGATRLQPSTITIGQASGALAGLAVKQQKAVKDVSISDLQKELINHNAVLVHYNDVSKHNSYFKELQTLSTKGIMSGYNDLTFKPGNELNRAQAASLISSIFSLTSTKPKTTNFADVARNSANAGVYALYDNNITSGCTNKPLNYCPNSSITVEQIGIFIYRSMYLKYPSKLSNYTTNGKIIDVVGESKKFMIDKELTRCNSTNWVKCSKLPLARVHAVSLGYKLLEIVK